VQVIAEFRANTLIVQAAPRDMLEITRLVESLDVEGGTGGLGAVNEVRIFKLTNSLAETLAPALQEAIRHHRHGRAQVQQQQQQQAQAVRAELRRRSPRDEYSCNSCGSIPTASSFCNRASWPTCGSRPTRGGTR
jgi:type II secretory pathway component GspD/PulD (secretin)